MGFVLLWLEALIACALLAALLGAGIAPLARVRLRRALIIAAMLPLLLLLCGLLVLAIMVRGHLVDIDDLITAHALLVASFAAVGVFSVWRCWPVDPPAARWSRERLGIGFLAASALLVLSFHQLDLAARSRLNTWATEATLAWSMLQPAPVAAHDNAAPEYLSVYASLPDDLRRELNEIYDRWVSGGQPSFTALPPEERGRIEDLLGRSEHALERVERASRLPGCRFSRAVPYDQSGGVSLFGVLLPELSGMRALVRLLMLRSLARGAAGDALGAGADIATILRMARHHDQSEFLVTQLVSSALSDQAFLAASILASHDWIAIDELEVATLDPFQMRMQRSLQAEAAAGVQTIAGVLGRGDDFSLDGSGFTAWAAVPFRVFLAEPELAAYHRTMQELISIASLPCRELWPRAEAFEEELSSGSSAGMITRQLVPAIARALSSHAAAQAHQDLLRAAVAVARHRRDRGRWPETREALAPDFLDSWPVDPFDGQPLRFRRDADALVIWSIGPDRDDDGGETGNWREDGDIALRLPLQTEEAQ